MQLVIAPNEKLRIKARPVKKITPELVNEAKQMIKLAESFKDPEGVGLAAPQVGRTEAFFIAKIGEKFDVYINPQITTFSAKTKVFFEGCLSIPDYYGEVNRPLGVTVKYLDIEGRQITKKLRDMNALVFQHEYDHLLGKLFMDYILAQKGRLFKVIGKDKIGADIFEEVKLL